MPVLKYALRRKTLIGLHIFIVKLRNYDEMPDWFISVLLQKKIYC